MKKFLILLVLITLPVLSFGQEASKESEMKNDIIAYGAVISEIENDSKINDLSYTKTEVTNLSYKKSNDLISIKAYRKSLQIRTKEIKSC